MEKEVILLLLISMLFGCDNGEKAIFKCGDEHYLTYYRDVYSIATIIQGTNYIDKKFVYIDQAKALRHCAKIIEEGKE